MKKIENLRELFIHQLKEQYQGERQQVVALPKLRKKSSDKELQHSIDYHIGKTKKQINRLDQIFTFLKRNLHGEVNVGVFGLIEEAYELAERCTNDKIRDAGIITSIQHLNHHNIASYNSLIKYANELDMKKIKKLLEKSLEEEKLTDQSLSDLVAKGINPKVTYLEV